MTQAIDQATKSVDDIIANAQGERRMVTLKQCQLSPNNARNAETYTKESIIERAALIVSQGGILQNLIGYEQTKKNK